EPEQQWREFALACCPRHERKRGVFGAFEAKSEALGKLLVLLDPDRATMEDGIVDELPVDLLEQPIQRGQLRAFAGIEPLEQVLAEQPCHDRGFWGPLLEGRRPTIADERRAMRGDEEQSLDTVAAPFNRRRRDLLPIELDLAGIAPSRPHTDAE